MSTKYKHLYWCEDFLGKYSRPIVARGALEARKVFAFNHGYYPTDCSAKRLTRLPLELQEQEINPLPDDTTLKSCGIMVVDPRAFTTDPLELKIISMCRRGFGGSPARVIYCKDLKNRYIFKEKT